MSAIEDIEDHRMSHARRLGLVIAVALTLALLAGITCVAPAWFESMPGDASNAEQAPPMIQYTRLEFALAIGRAIRGR